jgi:transcriptional regulator with XRE-family HTH domain
VQERIQQRFGRRILHLRTERGLTQEQLCERTGLSREHISYIENGHREACLVNIGKLAEGFGLSVSDLMIDV